MRLSLIVAVADNGIMGRGGGLPWRLSADLKRFKQLTMGHTIIMGRRTWESIGRPLPGRRTVVVSQQANYQPHDEVRAARSLDEALELAAADGDDEAFVVGGAMLYAEALSQADRLYLTRVAAIVEGDTSFPDVNWREWQLIESVECPADDQNEHACRFQVLQRVESGCRN